MTEAWPASPDAPAGSAAYEVALDPEVQAQLGTGPGSNPKHDLVVFLQRYCKRTMTKADVVYTRTIEAAAYVCTVTIVAVGGLEFHGEPRPTPKAAEASAATQALLACSQEILSLPPPDEKLAKNRASRQEAKQQKQLARASGLSSPASVKLPLQASATQVTAPQIKVNLPGVSWPTVVARPASEGGAKVRLVLGGASIPAWPGATAAGAPVRGHAPSQLAAVGSQVGRINLPPPAVAIKLQPTAGAAAAAVPAPAAAVHEELPKMIMTMFLQKLLGRAMTKQDVAWEVWKVSEGVWQASVRLDCLAELGQTAAEFTGEPQPSEKAAGHSAAQQVLDTYAAEIEAIGPICKRRRVALVSAGQETAWAPAAATAKAEPGVSTY